MKLLKSEHGFISTIALILIIVMAAAGGIVIYNAQNNKDKSAKTTTPAASSSTSKTEQTDPTKDWKTYTEEGSKIQFKYPSDWKLQINGKGDGYLLSGAITSPDNKLAIQISTMIYGLGGGSCPEAFPCPTVNVLSVKDLPGMNDKTVKYVEKITAWKHNGNSFAPSFGVTTVEPKDPISVGSSTRGDFALVLRGGSVPLAFGYNYTPNSDPTKGFKTIDEAKAFLDSPNAKTAKLIIQSVSKQ